VSGTGVLICTVIFYAGYVIGKYVRVLMEREELENISEQVLIIQNGLKTLREELQLLQTGVK
jgi:hypothetical protein